MEANTPSATTELNSAESIIAARGYAGLLGEIPSAFSATIRNLIQDQERNNGYYTPGAKFSVLRLLKGPSLLSPFYYAALTFRGPMIADPRTVTTAELLNLFSPADLSGLISLIYLHRKFDSIAARENWEPLREEFRKTTEAGGHIGAAIPRIGMPLGLFVGALPAMTSTLFEKHDPKGFKEYRRHLKTTGLPYDVVYETGRWGCTRFNVASMIMQLLGYGIELANNFSTGLSTPRDQLSDLQGDAYRCLLTQIWINDLLTSGKVPDIRHRGEFYPEKESLNALSYGIDVVRNQGTAHDFLAKRKEDISFETTPGLLPNARPSEGDPVDEAE